jgi:iron(III) transport system permease protein
VNPTKSQIPTARQISNSQQVLTSEDWIKRSLLIFVFLWLVAAIILPLYQLVAKSFLDREGTWNGFANYVQYFNTPALSTSIYNSFLIAIISTILAVTLGFLFAYGITRTAIFGKGIFRMIATLPIYIPSVAQAIGLIYLFGNQGIVTKGFFGVLPGFDINLYGFNGVVIGEVLYCLPLSVVILSTALRITDARLYEAAISLRTPSWRTFLTVTIPGVKYGLVSAIFVSFMQAFTDFGVPQVIGGNFNVLATDVYKQVIGQQNFEMGATISVLLILPTLLAFGINLWIEGRQSALISAKAVPLQPKPNLLVDSIFYFYCGAIALLVLSVFGTVIFASLVKVWPYNLSLSFSNYNFEAAGGGGMAAYWNTLQMATYSAFFGILIIFSSAYLVEKTKGLNWLRSLISFLSTLPNALPGMVLGLSYIFFFNQQQLTLPFTNIIFDHPLRGIYGTIAILVIANIIHYYTVSFITASTALKQLDPEFEAVAASMKIPFYRTFWAVTLPLCLPAALEIGIYLFVNAMRTVSALVYLYPPDFPISAVAIVNMEDAGEVAPAAAMSSLIVVTSLVVKSVYSLATIGIRRQTQAWLKR